MSTFQGPLITSRPEISRSEGPQGDMLKEKTRRKIQDDALPVFKRVMGWDGEDTRLLAAAFTNISIRARMPAGRQLIN